MTTLLTNYWSTVRGFNRDIWLYLAAWSLLGFGYFGIMGVLLNLYLLRLGYGPTFIGMFIGSGQLLWAALALPVAALGMRIGPRNGMAIGLSLNAAGAALVLLVEGLPPAIWSTWLIASWMLLWAGAAFNTVNSVPYLMGISSEEERNYAFAAQSSVMALTAFGGSLVAGFLPGLFAGWRGLSLEAPTPYRLALWIAPFLFLLGAWVILRARPIILPQPDKSTPEGARRPSAILLFVALTIFLIAATEGALRSFFNVYLDTGLAVETSRIGVIMGVGQLLPAAAALTAPVLMNWLGPGRTFSLTSLAAGLFMLPLALVPHWAAAAFSFVGIIGANATSIPARNVFSQICVGPQWRTSAAAAATIGLGLGWATMAALGGVIIEAWGFAALFLLGSLLALTSALLLHAYLRRQRARQPLPAGA
jgi:MFS family permease